MHVVSREARRPLREILHHLPLVRHVLGLLAPSIRQLHVVPLGTCNEEAPEEQRLRRVSLPVSRVVIGHIQASGVLVGLRDVSRPSRQAQGRLVQVVPLDGQELEVQAPSILVEVQLLSQPSLRACVRVLLEVSRVGPHVEVPARQRGERLRVVPQRAGEALRLLVLVMPHPIEVVGFRVLHPRTDPRRRAHVPQLLVRVLPPAGLQFVFVPEVSLRQQGRGER